MNSCCQFWLSPKVMLLFWVRSKVIFIFMCTQDNHFTTFIVMSYAHDFQLETELIQQTSNPGFQIPIVFFWSKNHLIWVGLWGFLLTFGSSSDPRRWECEAAVVEARGCRIIHAAGWKRCSREVCLWTPEQLPARKTDTFWMFPLSEDVTDEDGGTICLDTNPSCHSKNIVYPQSELVCRVQLEFTRSKRGR